VIPSKKMIIRARGIDGQMVVYPHEWTGEVQNGRALSILAIGSTFCPW